MYFLKKTLTYEESTFALLCQLPFTTTEIATIPCYSISSVQFSSDAQSCLTLCYPMNRSTPGLPVHHQLPEFTQTHVHRVRDAIQPSHPLPSPSPPAPNPSQHQSLFQGVNTIRYDSFLRLTWWRPKAQHDWFSAAHPYLVKSVTMNSVWWQSPSGDL